ASVSRVSVSWSVKFDGSLLMASNPSGDGHDPSCRSDRASQLHFHRSLPKTSSGVSARRENASLSGIVPSKNLHQLGCSAFASSTGVDTDHLSWSLQCWNCSCIARPNERPPIRYHPNRGPPGRGDTTWGHCDRPERSKFGRRQRQNLSKSEHNQECHRQAPDLKQSLVARTNPERSLPIVGRLSKRRHSIQPFATMVADSSQSSERGFGCDRQSLRHSGPGHRHIAPEDIMKYDPLLTAV